MCIINQEISAVHSTRIFTAHFKTHQLTIYENQVELQNSTPNAMILPFPGKFIDFKLNINDEKAKDSIQELFKIAKACFPVTKGKGKSKSNKSISNSDGEYLKVEEVGSYSVSVAPAIKDLARFDPQVFKINPEVFKILEKQYPKDYGFLICQLNESKAYHPFAYIHEAVSSEITHVPTLHYHISEDDKHHKDNSVSDDWDHTVYMISQSSGDAKLRMMNTSQKRVKLADKFIDRTCKIPKNCQDDFFKFFKKWIPNYPNLLEDFKVIAHVNVSGEATNGDILFKN